VNPAGRGAFHLGLRLGDSLRDELLVLVAAANERAKAAGLPPTVTPSGLVTHWIVERISEEMKRARRK
jgi:hypothetical protein